MNRISPAVKLVLVLILSAGTAAGGPLHFGPGPDRSSFAVSDFIVSRPFGPGEGPERRLDLSTELGWLFTIGDGLHLGPTIHVGSWLNGGWHSRWGLLARLRIDLDDRFSVAVTPGLVLADSPAPDGFAGCTVGASVALDDWIGLALRLDRTRAFPDGQNTVLRLGVGVGSTPGLCMTAAAGTAGAMAYWLSRMD